MFHWNVNVERDQRNDRSRRKPELREVDHIEAARERVSKQYVDRKHHKAFARKVRLRAPEQTDRDPTAVHHRYGRERSAQPALCLGASRQTP